MTVFILGMLTMWIVCGLITLLCNQFDVSEDVKDIAVGGFFWLPLIIVGNIFYRNFKKRG